MPQALQLVQYQALAKQSLVPPVAPQTQHETLSDPLAAQQAMLQTPLAEQPAMSQILLVELPAMSQAPLEVPQARQVVQ